MNEVAVLLPGNEDAEPEVLAEAVLVETLLHREARSKQPHSRDARPLDLFAGGIRNVEQRNPDGCLDGGGDLVHRVGTKHQQVGSRPLERPGDAGQDSSRLTPAPGLLQAFNVVEVDAIEDDPRRMQTAQALLDELVDLTVVRYRRLPAHAADQSYGLHRVRSSRGPRRVCCNRR